MTYTMGVKCCLSKLKEILAAQFLAGSYQKHRADHKTTSSTSFRPMRTTINDAYRNRVKQHTNNKSQLNTKMRSKISIDTHYILS